MQENDPGMFSGIRIKVLAGFGLILVAVVLAGIINFQSLKKLENAVNTLSKPNEQLQLMRQLMVSLNREQNAIQSYSISRNPHYLDEYNGFADTIQNKLTQLRDAARENSQESAILDSIQLLVKTREELLLEFAKLSRKDYDVLTNPQTAGVQQESDSAAQLKSDDTSLDGGSNKSNEKRVGQKKNFWQRLFGLGHEEDSPSDHAAVADTGALVSDTARRAAPVAAPVISSQEISRTVQRYSMEVLIFLQKDQDLLNRIRIHVRTLETLDYSKNVQRAQAARQVAKTANQNMSLIAVLGLLSTIIFSYLIMMDITRSNRLRLQLMEARKRAEKLARVKEEFLASMSHEIRTPLNAIVGFAEQLSKGRNADQTVLISAIQKASDHLLAIVNQILDFSKIESGKWEMEVSDFNFRELMKEIHDTFNIRALGKHIYFSCTVDPAIPQTIQGYELSLKQIVMNLVANAIKFTEKGGVLVHSYVDTVATEFRIAIEIKDTGIGIPLDKQKFIFEEFNQSDYEIARKYGGTGLGLAISRKLTELMGGFIRVKSQEGVGSVFTVNLPFKMVDQKEKNVPDREVSAVTSSAKSYRVLIVDDEEMNVMLCKAILDAAGMETQLAYSGNQALQRISEEDFDIVLMDLRMPEMSGTEVARRIRNHSDPSKRSLLMIALTANIFESNSNKPEFFDDLLTKPFRENDLLGMLQKHLNNRKHFAGDFRERETTEIHPNAVPEVNPPQEAGRLYSLRYLEGTSGSNPQFLRMMMESFIKNSALYIDELKRSVEAKDWNAVGQVVHRMIPAFRYLDVSSVVPKLEQMEALCEGNPVPETVGELVNEICSKTLLVREQLEKQAATQFIASADGDAVQEWGVEKVPAE